MTNARYDAHNRGRRGQALIESALVFMATLMMILGIMDFGQVLMNIQMMNERARAGARWASTHVNPCPGNPCNSGDAAKIQNYVAYGTPAAPSGSASGIFGLRPQHVTVQRLNSGTPNDTIRVTVRKPLVFLSPYIAGHFQPKPAIATSPVESLGATQ
ncbi:MAG TPA: TadE/TadG family type IV pilus assembly protein [Bryobacteraceae bacterium]|nr:TadE/TadG family type IV pilus assembly protein [Bryobacteraceae bacterium]